VAIIHIWWNGSLLNRNSAWNIRYPIIKCASMRCQQFVVLCNLLPRHCPDIRAHNGTIDSPYRQKSNILQEQHWFQNNRYGKLENMQKILLAAQYAILVRYYYQTAKARALYESTDGHAGKPADNQPNSDGLGDMHRTVPELTVWLNWEPWPPIWQWFGFDCVPDQKQRSGTVANTTLSRCWLWHVTLRIIRYLVQEWWSLCIL